MTLDEIKTLQFNGYAWLKILSFTDLAQLSQSHSEKFQKLVQGEIWDEVLNEVIQGWLAGELPESCFYQEFCAGPWVVATVEQAEKVLDELLEKQGCRIAKRARPWFDEKLPSAEAIFILDHPWDIPAVALINRDLCALFFQVD